MRRLLLLLPLLLAASACDSLSPKAQTVEACKEILVPSLLDIESYRERSEYRIIQSEKDNPVVYGWEWNSRNSMGGYTQPNLQLCYRNKDGEIVTQNFELDDDIGIETFLRETSPLLQKKEDERIAKEKAAKEEKERKIAEAQRKANEAAQRRIEAARRAQAAKQAEEQEKARREAELVRTAKSSLKSYCNSLNGKRPNFQGIVGLKQPTTSEDMIHSACLSGNYDYFVLGVWKQVRRFTR